MSLNPVNPYKTKLELISIIQNIPEDDILSIKNLLESIVSHSIDQETIKLLTAPIDNEPLTQEEIELSEKGWKEHQAGKSIPLSQLLNSYGEESEQ
jgi:hypothetical protein